MQWRHKEDPVVDDADAVDEPESDDYAMELRDGSDLDRDPAYEAAVDRTDDLALRSFPTAPSAPKPLEPWRGAVADPSHPPPPNLAAPTDALQLEWVHGYRAQDCRSNLAYAAGDAIVYPAAMLVVRLKARQWQQKFMTEHSDEVTCLAVSPDRRLVASAQIGRKPSIVIFDAVTMETLQVAAPTCLSCRHPLRFEISIPTSSFLFFFECSHDIRGGGGGVPLPLLRCFGASTAAPCSDWRGPLTAGCWRRWGRTQTTPSPFTTGRTTCSWPRPKSTSGKCSTWPSAGTGWSRVD
jgi:hypothetical protein